MALMYTSLPPSSPIRQRYQRIIDNSSALIAKRWGRDGTNQNANSVNTDWAKTLNNIYSSGINRYSPYGERYSGWDLAFGTSVSFGVINSKREIVRTCNGENWDIGDYMLRTREKPYEVWYKLGIDGLRELEDNLPDDPYYHFGLRAGGLLTNLAVIFRPRTIGISGGIISSHGGRILDGIRDEVRTPVHSEPIEFVMLDGEETVMEGLTTLL